MATGSLFDRAVLAERFQRGDDDALREIFDCVAPKICHWLVARYRRSPLDCQRIEHLVNYAVWRAWRSRAKFDPERGTLEAWLYAIANRCCRGFLRSPQGRACRHEVGMDSDHLCRLCEYSTRGQWPDPADHKPEISELDTMVEKALDALPERQRFVLLSDASTAVGQALTEELADEMGVTRATARTYRKRGRERLDEELDRRDHKKLLAALRAERSNK